MNVEFTKRLPSIQDVKAMYPVSEELAQIKKKNDEEIKSVYEGTSDRLIIVVGPCSADRADSVLDYISRLRNVQEKVKDKILIIPRVYTNKPRTNGLGYKGMLHQPNANDNPDLFKGLLAIRKLHLDALRESGFSCADEMLYPENHQFLSDLLGYVAVGARSVENQLQRMVASAIEIPVGMKNPTSGDISVMINSVKAAQSSHYFAYAGWEAKSSGNLLSHAILRGSVNKYGRSIPNYHYEDLKSLSDAYAQTDLKNPAVIVDANHSNSGKQYEEQIRICKEVLHSCRHNEQINKLVKGLMIESYIEDGNQKPDGGVYGQSITDPCLGWEKTERLILDLADLR